MIVLYVVQSFYPATIYGGPIFSIHYACQALARRGIYVRVATTNANGIKKLDVQPREPVVLEPNYIVTYYDDTLINRFSWDFTRHLARDIRASELVHLQDVFSTYAAWTLFLACFYRRPVVLSPRGVFSAWALSSRRKFLKNLWLTVLVHPFVGNRSRVCFHATSEQEREDIQLLFPHHRITVVPNAIDCAAFDATPAMSRLDFFHRFFPDCAVSPINAVVALAMGRLHSVKGFDIAIRSVSRLVAGYPNLVLLIAGSDEGEGEELGRLIDELGLTGDIALVGEVRNLEKLEFLRGGDIFLFPSHSENFGLACLEALAAGLPVVASCHTPWSAVESNGAGRFANNTPNSFATAIAELLASDLTSMRDAARRLARRFDLSAVAEKFDKFYQELINAQRT